MGAKIMFSFQNVMMEDVYNIPPVIRLLQKLLIDKKFTAVETTISPFDDRVRYICTLAHDTTMDDLEDVFQLYPIQQAIFSSGNYW